MKHSYVLETERLILRMPVPDDAEQVFVWVSDPKVNRFMPYALYTSVDQARDWLASLADPEHSDYNFGFVRKSDGVMIGSGSIGPREERGEKGSRGCTSNRIKSKNSPQVLRTVMCITKTPP